MDLTSGHTLRATARRHAAALAVRAGELASEFSGPELGEAVRKARIAAIAAATGKR